MNPRLIGIDRTGIIDEIHWKFAVQTAIAAMGGFAVGLHLREVFEWRVKSAGIALAFAALALSLWTAASGCPHCRNLSRFCSCRRCTFDVVDQEHVPPKRKSQHVPFSITGMCRVTMPRSGCRISRDIRPIKHRLPRIWRLSPGREKARQFTRELYARDMSTPESARWMRDADFPGFLSARSDLKLTHSLLQQIARNPDIELVRKENAALLYRVR